MSTTRSRNPRINVLAIPALSLLLLPAAPCPAADGAFLVADLNRDEVNSDSLFAHTPHTVYGGELYFAAQSSRFGSELWRSDGTAAGTRLVRDLSPGSHSSFPMELVVWESRLYFVADDGVFGRELWSTDGTAEGTTMVRDIYPGWRSGLGWLGSVEVFNDRLYFTVEVYRPDAVRSLRQCELWSSDGTRDGTQKVVDVCDDSNVFGFGGLFATGLFATDAHLFSLVETSEGWALWSSDGTPEGAQTVLDHCSSSDPNLCRPEMALGRTLLFLRDDPDLGVEPSHLTPLGDVVLFSAAAGDLPGLWRSDGTAAGTWFLGFPEPGTELLHGADYFFTDFYRDGERLLFCTKSSALPGLWRTDGTGVDLIAPSFCPGANHFTAAGDLLFFAAEYGYSPLWVTDRTAEGTRELDRARVPSPREMVVLNSRVLYSCEEGEGVFVMDVELCSSDGTEEGTNRLVDICPGTSSSSPRGLVRLGDRIYFAANDCERGSELWSSDGTAAGTALVADLLPGVASSSPRLLTPWHDRLFFFTRAAGGGDELWSSDGTAAGTWRVRDLSIGDLPTFVSETAATSNGLFFVAANETTGSELWVTRGTARSTGLVRDVYPGAHGSYPRSLRVVDDVLVWSAADAEHGHEPWVSDGSTAGTRLLADVVPGESSSYPRGFAAAGDYLYFQADDPATGRELWALERNHLPDPEVLSLVDDRFELRVRWRNQYAGTTGVGRPVRHSDNTGFFWFFSPDNIELIVKVLDGGGVNGWFWVFYGALSDVEYVLTVTDRQTGAQKIYLNPPGTLCGRGDTRAFPRTSAAGRLPPATDPGSARRRDGCGATPEELCLHDGRFRVEVRWRNQYGEGGEGLGRAVEGTRETGYFWFFDPDNLELAIKVLDGRPLTGHFWVFYGGLSDVEYWITVTDTSTGAQTTYYNPPGRICGGADVHAL
ncbi:MAG: hypothetical protein GY856_13600 [bacterium]|nr:hypothetical protein [bacterium]